MVDPATCENLLRSAGVNYLECGALLRQIVDPATLAILVGGAGSAISLVRGLSSWLHRSSRSTLTVVQMDGGEYRISSAEGATKLVEQLTLSLAKDNKDKKDKMAKPPPDAEPK